MCLTQSKLTLFHWTTEYIFPVPLKYCQSENGSNMTDFTTYPEFHDHFGATMQTAQSLTKITRFGTKVVIMRGRWRWSWEETIKILSKCSEFQRTESYWQLLEGLHTSLARHKKQLPGLWHRYFKTSFKTSLKDLLKQAQTGNLLLALFIFLYLDLDSKTPKI